MASPVYEDSRCEKTSCSAAIAPSPFQSVEQYAVLELSHISDRTPSQMFILPSLTLPCSSFVQFPFTPSEGSTKREAENQAHVQEAKQTAK